MSNVNISSNGIQKILKRYNPEQAIAEYIWNGFDAKASTVLVNYKANALGALEYLEISDNGYGINFKDLAQKFEPFYESEKTIEITAPVHTSAMHGKNGVGRLTFFSFAYQAEWKTTFETSEGLKSGLIQMSAGRLNYYKQQLVETPFSMTKGTTVTFRDLGIGYTQMEEEVLPFLIKEFCWFLELNRSAKFKIVVNGNSLDYSENIVERKKKIIKYPKSDVVFDVTFVQWKSALHRELSKYYFQNSDFKEIYKDFTTLNKKADDFFHSVYIQSSFFDKFNFKSSESDHQVELYDNGRSSPEYRYLIKELNKFILAKRKPYLRTFGQKMVEKYDQDGILPTYSNEWEEKYKKPLLEETLIALYEAEPKLFTNLNVDQKKTFVRFLDLLLDSNERGRVFEILDGIIELEPEEKQDLANLLKTTRLNHIISTIKLIEDRYRAYYQIRDLVFNKDLRANEVDHLQKAIESHYWIFGEQYNLVTAAEIKFEEALRRYTYLLTEKDTSTEIDHPDKLREMDIFACRQNVLTDRIENIVVELKHPLVSLGSDQYMQVDKYLGVIIKQPEFNAPNMFWEFYLIGNKFDSSNFIERQINTNKNHGISSLALSIDDGRVKVYIKTWSEIFADFEMKHRFIDEKLKLERLLLVNELSAPEEVVSDLQGNGAGK